MYRIKPSLSLLFPVLLFLAIACANSTTEQPITTMQLTPDTTLRLTATLRSSLMLTPSSKYSITPTNAVSDSPATTISPVLTITPSPTVTPTQTSTSAPTLSENQAIDYFLNYLKYDANCTLPCWWGITPGLSTWDTARELMIYIRLSPRDETKPDGYIYHTTQDIYINGIKNNVYFRDQNGIVEAIYVTAEATSVDSSLDRTYFQTLWRSYSPSQINLNYGAPSRIWVAIDGPYETGAFAYRLYVFYDNIGFMVFNQGIALRINEANIPMYKICPTWQDQVWAPILRIYIRPQRSKTSLEELARLKMNNLKPIDIASNISPEEFHRRLLPGNEPACFNTPQEMWR